MYTTSTMMQSPGGGKHLHWPSVQDLLLALMMQLQLLEEHWQKLHYRRLTTATTATP